MSDRSASSLRQPDGRTFMSLSIPARVRIREEGPRDGWQNIDAPFIPTDAKRMLIEGLLEAGLDRISITSMVSPKWVPQLADADELLMSLTRRPGVSYEVLVPNNRGLDRLLPLVERGAPVDEIGVVVSASEAHNRANLNRSVEDTLTELDRMAIRLAESGLSMVASIATSFGCSIAGRVPATDVLRLGERLVAMGASEIVLGDTTGMATPKQAVDVIGQVRDALPGVRVTPHFHDTRGMGLANILAALAIGIDSFESSYGELGGCQFAIGATGNVATESLVAMLDGMGVETGVDVDGLIDVTRRTERVLGTTLPSKLAQAGPVRWEPAEAEAKPA
jgi:hydroxymethylglutaryl-CoA lyase